MLSFDIVGKPGSNTTLNHAKQAIWIHLGARLHVKMSMPLIQVASRGVPPSPADLIQGLRTLVGQVDEVPGLVALLT